MSARPLTPVERIGARIVTGPLGHLVAGALDWITLAARVLWAKAHGRSLW